MIFEPLPVKGAWLVRPEPISDKRGYFARIICEREFAAAGLKGHFVQSSISFNRARGTFRGMHFQLPPSTEAKLVRCIQGTIQDVLVDLRPESESFLQSAQIQLEHSSHVGIYIPPGVAHGFQTLAADTVVMYQMTDEFRSDLDFGFRWDDPAFGIQLPEPVTVIADRDTQFMPFSVQALMDRVAGVALRCSTQAGA